MTAGEAVIDEWTFHCPACGRPVSASPGAEAVACPHCRAAFAPETLATAAHRKPSAPDVPPDPEDELLGRTLGGWRLTRLLGRGGMGRVYEAEAAQGGRRVALKVLAEELARDPTFVKRFRREARVLASLAHPHVVEVLEQGEDEGRLWFAMEYVRGENLRRRLEVGPLPPEEVVRLAGEITSALAYAHERGVVHRDLKPENVLLDEDGHVHLVDFGLSRLAGDGGAALTSLLTRTDVILGTYEYMAPEQRRGDKDVDGRADVFALGVMLYEMLTGSLPLGRFAAASQVRPEVPPSFDAVVNKALATDRGARYASAEEMHEALREAWARRRRPAPAPAGPPAARRPVRPPQTELLGEIEVHRLRAVLKHVDTLAALDRVLGILLIAGFFSVGIWNALNPVFWAVPVGGIVLLIAGILMLDLGGRMSRMKSGARDAQLTASVLLLFFPPFLTAMGIYGLVVLSGDRARRAFAVGRKTLEGPRPVVASKVLEVARPVRRPAPWLGVRLLFLAALLWTVYAALVAVETGAGLPGDTLEHVLQSMDARRLTALGISAAGLLLSLVLAVVTFLERRRRRGFGLALTALLLFAACTTVLSNAHRVHRLADVDRLRRAPWAYALPPPPSLPRLEIAR